MIETYKRLNIPDITKEQFSMPLSLRYLKEIGQAGIDWKELHLIDLTSLIYSLRIDTARQKMEMDKQKRLSERGISSVSKATEADFDAL